MSRITLTLIAALAASSCGGPGHMDGTVAGANLTVRDAIFSLVRGSSGDLQGVFLFMGDKPDLCAALKANRQPKSLTGLSLSLVRYSDMAAVLSPDSGEYTIITSAPPRGGRYASAMFSRSDVNCTPTIAPASGGVTSGLVKVESLKAEPGGSAVGTFDLTFGGGDKATGSFNATFCDATSTMSNARCE
jgi:hypothetical protein